MIIGFCGPMQAGKDTATQHLVDHYGFERRAYRDKMVETTCALFDLPFSEYEEFKLHGIVRVEIATLGRRRALSGRQFMESLGTAVGRQIFGWDFWINLTLPASTESHHNIVLSDVRFENEAKRIHELDGRIIEILRRGTDYDDGHISRQRLPNHFINATIHNDFQIERLYEQIDRTLDNLLDRELT